MEKTIYELQRQIAELMERNRIQEDIINGKYKKPSDHSKDIYIAELKKDKEHLNATIYRLKAEYQLHRTHERWNGILSNQLDRVEALLKRRRRYTTRTKQNKEKTKIQRRLGPACYRMSIRYKSFSA